MAALLRLPTISVLLVVGLLVGPTGLDLLPPDSAGWFEVSASVALTMIGFLLGGEFDRASLARRGVRTVVLSLGLTLGSAAVVTAGAWLAGAPVALALLLGGIAPATDPAATVAVLEELGVEDELAATLRGIVALDDVWGVVVFSLLLAAAQALGGGGGGGALLHAAFELVGSVLVGGLLGFTAGKLGRHLLPGPTTHLEAFGLVLACAGLCAWLGLSTLIASVAMGAALVNTDAAQTAPFGDIQAEKWPFLVVFFVLAGAQLDLRSLAGTGLVFAAYVLSRVLGRYVGVGLGAVVLGSVDRVTALWTPTALLPQAGVALGLALAAGHAVPEAADTLLTVAVAGTLVFELVGPPLARFAVVRARAGG